MNVEKKIEGTIRDALTTALTGVLSDAWTVRTWLAESAYVEGDGQEDISYPLVFVMAQPNERETGHTPERTVEVGILCATHINDDLDRRDLATLYETVRNCMETTTFDFGANIIYTEDSYSVSNGVADVEENEQRMAFSVRLDICAGSFSWVE